jgi:hypothetical protein
LVGLPSVQAPASPDDFHLQASISQADELLCRQMHRSAPQQEPHPPGGQQPPPATGSAADSQQRQPQQQQQQQQQQDGSDWLRRMQEADAALKAAIERRNLVVGEAG